MTRFARYAVAVVLVLVLAVTASEAAAAGAAVKGITKGWDDILNALRIVAGQTAQDFIKDAPRDIHECYQAAKGKATRVKLCGALFHDWLGTTERSERYKAKLERLLLGDSGTFFRKSKGLNPPRQPRLVVAVVMICDLSLMSLEECWRNYRGNIQANGDGEQVVPDRAARQPSPPL